MDRGGEHGFEVLGMLIFLHSYTFPNAYFRSIRLVGYSIYISATAHLFSTLICGISLSQWEEVVPHDRELRQLSLSSDSAIESSHAALLNRP